jgi:hypothetical protein
MANARFSIGYLYALFYTQLPDKACPGVEYTALYPLLYQWTISRADHKIKHALSISLSGLSPEVAFDQSQMTLLSAIEAHLLSLRCLRYRVYMRQFASIIGSNPPVIASKAMIRIQYINQA